ncbi:MAG TPA: hypothetical protein VFQ44_26035, partial [Streptosporangiaceae bacterium]|nr:hypothetical protein [Streptosporangiaceae bacterium]
MRHPDGSNDTPLTVTTPGHPPPSSPLHAGPFHAGPFHAGPFLAGPFLAGPFLAGPFHAAAHPCLASGQHYGRLAAVPIGAAPRCEAAGSSTSPRCCRQGS